MTDYFFLQEIPNIGPFEPTLLLTYMIKLIHVLNLILLSFVSMSVNIILMTSAFSRESNWKFLIVVFDADVLLIRSILVNTS